MIPTFVKYFFYEKNIQPGIRDSKITFSTGLMRDGETNLWTYSGGKLLGQYVAWKADQPGVDYQKNCTVMDPTDEMKWSAQDCSDLETDGVAPVCQFPNPPDNTYIEETTGD